MMMRLLITSIIVLLTLSAAQAERVYKWIDSDGRVSYHSLPPPEGSGYTVEEKDIIDDTGDEPVGKRLPVKLYVINKCDACDLVRLYLQKRKVPFKEINVDKDVKKQRELKRNAGTMTVPSTIIGKKVVTGYNQTALDQELKAGGYPRIVNK